MTEGRRSWSIAAAVAAAITIPLASLTAASPATAAETGAEMSATSVADALSGAAASKVAVPTAAAATAEDAAVSSGSVTVSVPRNAVDGVDIGLNDTTISVQLPRAADAGGAVVLDTGAITYPSATSVANTVVPTDSGAQLLTTLSSTEAPTSYAYDIASTDGSTVAVADDGSALVIATSGEVLLRAEAPWAVDARGTAVPTHYELDGNKLVQVVDHTRGDYAYPIVADPRLDSGIGWKSILFNRHETETIASSGIVALGGATAACGVGGPVGVAACSIAAAAIGATAVYAKDNGPCVGLSFWGAPGTAVFGWNPFLHNGADCN
ncbi:hypothetical protein [Microbacterium sp. VKM Ac-2923]|uniref:hypothetical protein n=1 Tax=Microbacterium sp. VKM Ac-2923 TaxID=2929476 RepID=UPI001FB1CB6F|nr:hypothetical protein [Microbacterium sp. VKM Ac-2923]MCJ1706550.1 hypothetical protein [Microbacterium sp. VKM Ac-2923]